MLQGVFSLWDDFIGVMIEMGRARSSQLEEWVVIGDLSWAISPLLL